MFSNIDKVANTSTEDLKRRNQRKIVIAKAVLFTVAVSTAEYIGISNAFHYAEHTCRDVDESSVDSIKTKISDIYDGESFTDYSHVPAGSLAADMSYPSRDDRPDAHRLASSGLLETVDATMQWIDDDFVKATGVTTLKIAADIPSRDGGSAIGSFRHEDDRSIYINGSYFENASDQLELYSVLVHELGHAALHTYSAQKRICIDSSMPPDQFSSLSEKFSVDPNKQDAFQSTTVLSEYARTDPTEDIAEIYTGIWGYPTDDEDAISPQVEMLHYSLINDNPVIEQKTAVALAVLDDLRPGLADIALSHMAFVYENWYEQYE